MIYPKLTSYKRLRPQAYPSPSPIPQPRKNETRSLRSTDENMNVGAHADGNILQYVASFIQSLAYMDLVHRT